MAHETGRLLVFGDSLAFHGPEQTHPPADPRLWPQVAAADLGWQVDLVARIGWTARDVWWAVTKDPVVWGTYLPRASAVVFGVGGMDALPAVIPTYLREGIAYVRPGWLRRRVRSVYNATSPRVIDATGGLMRQLPQAASDSYLTRTVRAIRTYYPDLPMCALSPSPHRAAAYPSQRYHRPSVEAARRWAAGMGVELVDVEGPVQRGLASGRSNPDGMHWGWQAHAQVGRMVAATVCPEVGGAAPAVPPVGGEAAVGRGDSE